MENELARQFNDQNRLVRANVQEMRANIPEIKRARVVTIIEANLAWHIADDIAHNIELAVSGNGSVSHMMHADRTQPGKASRGVWTTADSKFMGVHNLLQLLL
jgi:hypothetical protein